MKRLFITGGTGFFGKSILDYRLRHPEFAAEYGMTILSRDPERFAADFPVLANQPGVSFVQGDIRELSISNVQPSTRFDAIIHAATSAVTTISDEEQTSVIVDGARSVVDFARATGVTKVLFTSSGAVYGPPSAPVGEDAPCAPVTAYGKAKLEAERMLVASGLDVKLARCFAFTGPYLNRHIHFAIGNFIEDALQGRQPRLTGDGTPLRSYLYADDLVEWLFTILEHGESGRPYNVGSPEAISIHDLAALVMRTITGNDCPQSNNRAIVKSNNCYVPVTTRAEAELGLRVRIPLVDAIRLSAGEIIESQERRLP